MTKVLISSIAALRKTSIVFAALMDGYVLKEKFAFGRVIAFCIDVMCIAFITTSTSMDNIILKLIWMLSIIFKS